MCGDVESNPGPDDTLCEVLKTVQVINERSIRMESVQSTMADSIAELKEQQSTVFEAISDIKTRLENVEAQESMLEKWQYDLSGVRESVSRIEKDTHRLWTRLDDAEDRSRRDNLIFYGLPDVATESAEQ